MLWFQVILLIIRLLMEFDLLGDQESCVKFFRRKVGSDLSGMNKRRVRELFEEWRARRKP